MAPARTVCRDHDRLALRARTGLTDEGANAALDGGIPSRQSDRTVLDGSGAGRIPVAPDRGGPRPPKGPKPQKPKDEGKDGPGKEKKDKPDKPDRGPRPARGDGIPTRAGGGDEGGSTRVAA